jgi:hypothetical protein
VAVTVGASRPRAAARIADWSRTVAPTIRPEPEREELPARGPRLLKGGEIELLERLGNRDRAHVAPGLSVWCL